MIVNGNEPMMGLDEGSKFKNPDHHFTLELPIGYH
jgi:hypothetical protein